MILIYNDHEGVRQFCQVEHIALSKHRLLWAFADGASGALMLEEVTNLSILTDTGAPLGLKG